MMTNEEKVMSDEDVQASFDMTCEAIHPVIRLMFELREDQKLTLEMKWHPPTPQSPRPAIQWIVLVDGVDPTKEQEGKFQRFLNEAGMGGAKLVPKGLS